MVISQPPGNNPSAYTSCLPPTPLNCSECFQRHLMFYMQLQHQGNSWNGAIKHIFYTNQIHGGIISRLFFIHFVAPCACSSSSVVKILLQIFLYEDLSTLAVYTSVGCISPPECQQDRTFVTQPILLSENIPNIWHKSSTKHKEVRPDWNDKNDNANYAPSYHMEGFTNGSGCHF